MKTATLVASVAIAIGTVAVAQTPTQMLAVPAFFPLSSNGVVNRDWERIRQAGPIAKIVVADLKVIGSGVAGPEVCTRSPADMFDCLRNNKQYVLGYVYTNSGQRGLEVVLHGGDSDVYVEQWYNTYGGHIDGIFFDVGPSLDPATTTIISEADQKAYYQTLYQTLTTPGSPNYRPGPCGATPTQPGHACIMVNASQFGNDWVMSVADYVVLWERAVDGQYLATCPKTKADAQDYFTLFCPGAGYNPACAYAQNPTGWYSAPANVAKAAHVIYSVKSAIDADRVIAQSRLPSYGTPRFLYIHDQDCAVYSQLPAYFEHVVANLAGGMAIPVPVKRADGTVVVVPVML